MVKMVQYVERQLEILANQLAEDLSGLGSVGTVRHALSEIARQASDRLDALNALARQELGHRRLPARRTGQANGGGDSVCGDETPPAVP